MTTDAAPSGQNKRSQRVTTGNQSYNLRPMKFRRSLNEFANPILCNHRRQQYSSFRHKEIESINIINQGNQIGTSNNRKARNIDPDYSPPRIQNKISNAPSRLSREGDYKLKEKFFQQTYFQMNLNQTIDLFSQHFNNLMPRLMSTIREYGEIAIDALNKIWKKELPRIYAPIPLLPAVQKKIKEEQIEAMIKAPLWLGQIQYTELVNENVQSLMLGQSNEILELGISLIKKNLKLLLGKICCFLID
ncbi:MAG: hypothetical protein EZS28_037776 [Streblomastix strix]|uniref:Uncharacterized protein n=1 Tax=Streblomastix strix TaxID=222440 RepID=A0A5J4U8H0_9EUKA|nr:MAG: hypothetical protein EZS28_037776 [Streblomastix strix]